MLSKAAKNLSPLRKPEKKAEASPQKSTAKTAAETNPTKKTVKIESPINTDEEVQSPSFDKPS